MDGGIDKKRMRLSYAGACRVCGAQLPAGAMATYERTTKTVRCLRHDTSPPVELGAVGVREPCAVGVLEPAVGDGR